jgi:choloylglycine hydrolase
MNINKKLLIFAAASLGIINPNLEACTEVLVHRDNVTIVGRTLDFPISVGIQIAGYNKGLKQVSTYMSTENTDVNLGSWEVKYPYMGRELFNTGLLMDGANNQGLSAAVLYLPGSIYPTYNPESDKPVLSFFDIVSFSLATSANVDEALENIAKYQFLDSPVIISDTVAITEIPLHLTLKDKSGNSAVIESINGKFNIYKGKKAGNVLTNQPQFSDQLKNLANYNSLLNYNKNEQKEKFGDIPGFKVMMQASELRSNIAAMVGIPGDYSPPSRFVRATFLEKTMPKMNNTNDYAYLVEHILDSVTVPYSGKANSTATLWQTEKNLIDNTIKYKDLLYLYNGKIIVADENINSYNMNEIFSTGIPSINGTNKLQKPISNPQNYKLYTMQDFTSGKKAPK